MIFYDKQKLVWLFCLYYRREFQKQIDIGQIHLMILNSAHRLDIEQMFQTPIYSIFYKLVIKQKVL